MKRLLTIALALFAFSAAAASDIRPDGWSRNIDTNKIEILVHPDGLRVGATIYLMEYKIKDPRNPNDSELVVDSIYGVSEVVSLNKGINVFGKYYPPGSIAYRCGTAGSWHIYAKSLDAHLN
ncbi:hypothetical protein JCM18905_5008 [Vibrio sp. JCM 18905]|nr:hypothetical protein JCM18905_5008 [Vibrio sp. JCM 18905]